MRDFLRGFRNGWERSKPHPAVSVIAGATLLMAAFYHAPMLPIALAYVAGILIRGAMDE